MVRSRPVRRVAEVRWGSFAFVTWISQRPLTSSAIISGEEDWPKVECRPGGAELDHLEIRVRPLTVSILHKHGAERTTVPILAVLFDDDIASLHQFAQNFAGDGAERLLPLWCINAR